MIQTLLKLSLFIAALLDLFLLQSLARSAVNSPRPLTILLVLSLLFFPSFFYARWIIHRKDSLNQRWLHSMALSWLMPGLGQAVFTGKWWKVPMFIIFTAVAIALPYLALLLLIAKMPNLIRAILWTLSFYGGLFSLPLVTAANLYDAYSAGRHYTDPGPGLNDRRPPCQPPTS